MMIQTEINGIPLVFETEPSLFSPAQIDRGTLAMLSALQLSPGEKLLDLGCGCGAVGIYAAKILGAENVVMSDIDPLALDYARRSAARNDVAGVTLCQSDGLRDVKETGFTWILSNPPYHTDFSVAKHFIEKGFNRLCIGGKMLLVTKRRDWYKQKCIAVFGGVSIQEIDGYFVFTAEKRSTQYAAKKK